MILGIGTDILEIEHFKRVLQKEPALLERVFTPFEIKKGNRLSPPKKVAYFAKRFAAKEAVSKACGTGIGERISWQDIKISNTEVGQPVASLSKKALTSLKKHFKTKNIRLFISLSDEKNSALAFAVLETD